MVAPNPFAEELAALATALASAPPKQLRRLLFAAFRIVAAAGDVPRAGTLLAWMDARVPPSSGPVTALSDHAIDGFCLAAGGADPRPGGEPLAARVAAGERRVRERLLANAYAGETPVDDAWAARAPDDPWRRIDRWRRVQALAEAGAEHEALGRLVGLLEELPGEARGAGHGDELVLAIDLALRLGQPGMVEAWLAAHGARLAREPFLLETALCLPAVASFAVRGGLRETLGLDAAALDAALAALDAALATALAPRAPAPAPDGVERRQVSCEYSQVYLLPATPPLPLRFFEDEADFTRGMSLFADHVALVTPDETAYVDAEVSLAGPGLPPLEDAVQAVAFPLAVAEPLVLSCVTGGDEEPLSVPPGVYDVLARFVPKDAPPELDDAGLRVFSLRLTFHPSGSLGAPQTLRREGS